MKSVVNNFHRPATTASEASARFSHIQDVQKWSKTLGEDFLDRVKTSKENQVFITSEPVTIQALILIQKEIKEMYKSISKLSFRFSRFSEYQDALKNGQNLNFRYKRTDENYFTGNSFIDIRQLAQDFVKSYDDLKSFLLKLPENDPPFITRIRKKGLTALMQKEICEFVKDARGLGSSWPSNDDIANIEEDHFLLTEEYKKSFLIPDNEILKKAQSDFKNHGIEIEINNRKKSLSILKESAEKRLASTQKANEPLYQSFLFYINILQLPSRYSENWTEIRANLVLFNQKIQ